MEEIYGRKTPDCRIMRRYEVQGAAYGSIEANNIAHRFSYRSQFEIYEQLCRDRDNERIPTSEGADCKALKTSRVKDAEQAQGIGVKTF